MEVKLFYRHAGTGKNLRGEQLRLGEREDQWRAERWASVWDGGVAVLVVEIMLTRELQMNYKR